MLTKEISLLRAAINKYFTRRNIDYAFVGMACLLGLYLNWNVAIILFFCFIVWFILNPLHSTVLIKIAVFLIVLAPVFLLIKKTDRASQVALFAFFILCLAWIESLIEFRRLKKGVK